MREESKSSMLYESDAIIQSTTDGISKWSSIRAIKGQIVNTKDHTSTSLPVKTVFCTLAINSTCNFFVK